MNHKFEIQIAVVVLLFTFDSRLSTTFAQGSLTPPCAPAPTMKTLAQIEPRTPISSLPYIITNGLFNFSVIGTNDLGPVGYAATNLSSWANISH